MRNYLAIMLGGALLILPAILPSGGGSPFVDGHAQAARETLASTRQLYADSCRSLARRYDKIGDSGVDDELHSLFADAATASIVPLLEDLEQARKDGTVARALGAYADEFED